MNSLSRSFSLHRNVLSNVSNFDRLHEKRTDTEWLETQQKTGKLHIIWRGEVLLHGLPMHPNEGKEAFGTEPVMLGRMSGEETTHFALDVSHLEQKDIRAHPMIGDASEFVNLRNLMRLSLLHDGDLNVLAYAIGKAYLSYFFFAIFIRLV